MPPPTIPSHSQTPRKSIGNSEAAPRSNLHVRFHHSILSHLKPSPKRSQERVVLSANTERDENYSKSILELSIPAQALPDATPDNPKLMPYCPKLCLRVPKRPPPHHPWISVTSKTLGTHTVCHPNVFVMYS